MLRLDTHFEISNVHEPRLFKVITPQEYIENGSLIGTVEASADKLLLWDDNSIPIEAWNPLPVAGIITSTKKLNHDTGDKIILSNPRHTDVVKPGDVIAVSADSDIVRVLYRRGANSNLLFMTDRCNSLCLMCSQPPKSVDDEWHIAQNLELIDLMDSCEEQIGISGGEPTLFPDGLLAILQKAKEFLPQKSIHVLSNGRLLRQPFWIKELSELNHPQLTWGIPLYADCASDHDHLVQAPGAFSETMQGLYNLSRANQRIEVRVVLCRLTARRLPELARFIFRNLPFADHVAFMAIESTGLARKNYQELWIDPLDYQDPLETACHFLSIRGLAVSIYNLPLCVTRPSLLPYYRKSISDWKNQYLEPCKTCSAKKHCAGFFKSHSTPWQSRGISAVTDDYANKHFENQS